MAVALAAGALATVAAGAGTPVANTAPEVRIKDLVDIEGVRGNDLVGYGLVVGLDGTGDSLRNSPYTEESLANLLERLGVNVQGETFRSKNVAAVLVTAALPPFARTGRRIDVNVSTIGDAKSLLGGTLIMTPLNAADGEIYAVAQGTVLAGGVRADGEAERVVTGVPTAGIIPSGARVEREIAFDFAAMDTIRFALREPDFTTAARIEDAVNRALGAGAAQMLDSGTIALRLPTGASIPRTIAQLENVSVAPARAARVVVDQRSGTIVMGADVRISKVAIAQGNLTIRVREQPLPSQPNPFSPGETIVLPRTDAEIVDEPGTQLAIVDDTVTLADLVEGLNALGVRPRDMIDILATIKAAGALHADFIMQ